MRHLKTIIFILIVSLFTGCSSLDPKYINLQSKPTLYEYSNQVYKKLKDNKDFSLQVFDANVYKYFPVEDEDNDILLSFFESLNNNNYVSEFDYKDKILKYKILINFSDSKYVINVYDNEFVTLYPWDGNFPEDMITMNGVSNYNNLYSFCTYVINKAHQNNGSN